MGKERVTKTQNVIDKKAKNADDGWGHNTESKCSSSSSSKKGFIHASYVQYITVTQGKNSGLNRKELVSNHFCVQMWEAHIFVGNYVDTRTSVR